MYSVEKFDDSLVYKRENMYREGFCRRREGGWESGKAARGVCSCSLDLIRLESSSPYHILYPDQSSSATEITRVSGQARKVKLLVCVCMPGGVWVCVKGETHGMGVWFARNNRQVRSEKI